MYEAKMNLVVTISSIVIFPILIGYIYGQNDIDPNTEFGKKYYE